MSKRDSLAQRGSREASGCVPVPPATPAWVPASVSYTQIPEKFRAMIAEVIEPAYEQHLAATRRPAGQLTHARSASLNRGRCWSFRKNENLLPNSADGAKERS